MTPVIKRAKNQKVILQCLRQRNLGIRHTAATKATAAVELVWGWAMNTGVSRSKPRIPAECRRVIITSQLIVLFFFYNLRDVHIRVSEVNMADI